jgi:hypothetical protein
MTERITHEQARAAVEFVVPGWAYGLLCAYVQQCEADAKELERLRVDSARLRVLRASAVPCTCSIRIDVNGYSASLACSACVDRRNAADALQAAEAAEGGE